MPEPRLSRDFFARSPLSVAPELLGKHLICASDEGVTRGRIVETEAYLHTGDSASHSAGGVINRKNSTMFGRPGLAYVYTIHARQCFNVVTQPEGTGSAVLIRALEPLEGLDLMRTRRDQEHPRELARGPARLCEAMGIHRHDDGVDVVTSFRIWISDDGQFTREVYCGPRIGVTTAHELPFRFFLRDNPFVSGTRKMAEAASAWSPTEQGR